MKKSLSILSLCLLIFSCNSSLEQEKQDLQAQNDSLQQGIAYLDSLFTDFLSIQENLAQIRARETQIEGLGRQKGLENSTSTKEQILDDINVINDLLEKNRQTIAKMGEKMKRYSYEVGRYKTVMQSLKGQIAAKDSQIVELKERLVSMNFEVSQLNQKLNRTLLEKEKQREQLSQTMASLHEAFYAVGSFKDLKDNGVLTREGGLIGLGSTKTLPDDFNRDYFTQIDKTKMNRLPLDYDAKTVELITNHPEESYALIHENNQVVALEISDPQLFWEATNYLVIVLN